MTVSETLPMRGEMRRMRRFALRLPISLRFDGSRKHLKTETVELSAGGARFLLDAAPSDGAAFDFTLTFPPEITLAEAIRVRGRGRVLRSEPFPEGKTMVAVRLEDLAYLPPL